MEFLFKMLLKLILILINKSIKNYIKINLFKVIIIIFKVTYIIKWEIKLMDIMMKF